MNGELESNNSVKYWNEVHKDNKRSKITIDNWLDKFNDIIEKTKLPIIDLGCGSGNDTLYLLEKGKDVIPCDLSLNAIEAIRRDFSKIKEALCFDMLKGLPFDDDSCDIIIADLSLHYFKSDDTKRILLEIQRVLKRDGYLIFRVNSVNDVNHGAGKGKEIERNLYETTDGRLKRFFDNKDIELFFGSFERVYVKETSMRRYRLPKWLYEGCLKKKI